MRGFRLAGVQGEVVETAAQAVAALERAVTQPGCGVVILTEKVAAGIRREVEAIRLQRERPLLVEIPGPEGPMAGRKTLRRFVQEAVGLRVN